MNSCPSSMAMLSPRVFSSLRRGGLNKSRYYTLESSLNTVHVSGSRSRFGLYRLRFLAQ
jgi:hypothetical protein